MIQKERLLDYLKNHPSIDPMTAWHDLGIYRLSARINNLRNDGYIIVTEYKQVKNQFGESCSVANYRLIDQQHPTQSSSIG